jgi:hypothetical protein
VSQFNSYKICSDIFVPNKIYYDATKGVDFVFDKLNGRVFLVVFLLSIVYEHVCALLVFHSKESTLRILITNYMLAKHFLTT